MATKRINSKKKDTGAIASTAPKSAKRPKKPSAPKPEKKYAKTLYSCGVDWQHEIGEASDLEGKMPLYSTIEELKATRSCWEECGIVKLELTKVEWVEPQDLFRNIKRD